MNASLVLLFSGGLDSFIVYRLLRRKNVRPALLYVTMGHKYEQKEVETIEMLGEMMCNLDERMAVKYSGRLYLGDLEERDGHIPLRNLLLIETALVETRADVVLLAALSGETSTDKSGSFFRKVSKQMSELLYREVQVMSPVRGYTKTELVGKYLDKFNRPDDVEMLTATRSCYNTGHLPCGRCMACFRRWVAMSLNGIKEQYEQPPWEWEAIKSDRVGDWMQYGKHVGIGEWAGVIRNNLQAARALRKVKMYGN